MKIYPVVHINNPAEASKQATIALEEKADGVYLINHNGGDYMSDLFQTYNMVRESNPQSFIGINILGVSPLRAFQIIKYYYDNKKIGEMPNGLWADNAFNEQQAGETLKFKEENQTLNKIRYLGGVSFKYTETYTEDPHLAANLAEKALTIVETITTSGAGTGIAPTIAKISAMKKIIGEKGLLSIASGLDINNIDNYQGLVDEVLIGSGLETEAYSGIFDRLKLTNLINKVHQL